MNLNRNPKERSAREPGTSTKEGDLRPRIEAMAYSLYLKRGQTHGRSLEDWLEAERLVLEERRRSSAGGANPAGSEAAQRRTARASARPRPANEVRKHTRSKPAH